MSAGSRLKILISRVLKFFARAFSSKILIEKINVLYTFIIPIRKIFLKMKIFKYILC